jgi:hypothetical protein
LLSFSTFFSSIVEDDNKPKGFSSSLGFLLKCRKRQRVRILARCCSWLFYFSCKRWQRISQLVVIFCIFFFKCRRQRRAKRLIIIS